MSETPKKMEFMMMKDSAAELVMASNVAFIDSEDSCARRQTVRLGREHKCTYDSLLLDDVDRRVNVVLRCQGDSQKSVHDSCTSS